jgi:hypothetical protein
LGSPVEISAFSRILANKGKMGAAVTKSTKCNMYYTRKFGYFLAFLNFVPHITEIKTGRTKLPSELKEFGFNSPESVFVSIAVLSSSTFFWFWNVLSDCRNLNRRDLLAFPLNPDQIPAEIRGKLVTLGKKYISTLRSTSTMMLKSGLKIETFDYSVSKPIIDEIDSVLKEYYGFTDEELDFIVNYDIKYRMGRDSGGEDKD